MAATSHQLLLAFFWLGALPSLAFRQKNYELDQHTTGSAAQTQLAREKTSVMKSPHLGHSDPSVMMTAARTSKAKVEMPTGHAQDPLPSVRITSEETASDVKHGRLMVNKSSLAEMSQSVAIHSSRASSRKLSYALVFLFGMLVAFSGFWLLYPCLFPHTQTSISLRPCQPLQAPDGEEAQRKIAEETDSACPAPQDFLAEAQKAKEAPQRKSTKKATVTFSPSILAGEDVAEGEPEVRESQDVSPILGPAKADATEGSQVSRGFPKKNTKDLTEKTVAFPKQTIDDASEKSGVLTKEDVRAAVEPRDALSTPKSLTDAYGSEGGATASEPFVSFTLSTGSEKRPYRQHLLTQGSEIATFIGGEQYGESSEDSRDAISSADEGEEASCSQCREEHEHNAEERQQQGERPSASESPRG